MKYINILFIIGVCVVLLPIVGFSFSIIKIMLFVFGAYLMMLAVYLYQKTNSALYEELSIKPSKILHIKEQQRIQNLNSVGSIPPIATLKEDIVEDSDDDFEILYPTNQPTNIKDVELNLFE